MQHLLLSSISLHLHQFVHLPTKYGRTSSSILDIVLSSYPADISKVMVERELSDQCIVCFEASVFPNISISSSKEIYLYCKGNFTQLRHDLSAFAAQFFQSVPSSRSVNDNWLMFIHAVLAALEKHIPSKMVTDRCRRPLWRNSHANQAIRSEIG